MQAGVSLPLNDTNTRTQHSRAETTRNDIRPYSKYVDPYAHENQIDRMIIY